MVVYAKNTLTIFIKPFPEYLSGVGFNFVVLCAFAA